MGGFPSFKWLFAAHLIQDGRCWDVAPYQELIPHNPYMVLQELIYGSHKFLIAGLPMHVSLATYQHCHDDVIKWKHFPRYWPFGNSPVPGEFPAQRPVTRSFRVFFDLRLNKPFSKRSWGWWFETLSPPFWRHCNGDMVIQSNSFKWLFAAWRQPIYVCLFPVDNRYKHPDLFESHYNSVYNNMTYIIYDMTIDSMYMPLMYHTDIYFSYYHVLEYEKHFFLPMIYEILSRNHTITC